MSGQERRPGGSLSSAVSSGYSRAAKIQGQNEPDNASAYLSRAVSGAKTVSGAAGRAVKVSVSGVKAVKAAPAKAASAVKKAGEALDRIEDKAQNLKAVPGKIREAKAGGELGKKTVQFAKEKTKNAAKKTGKIAGSAVKKGGRLAAKGAVKGVKKSAAGAYSAASKAAEKAAGDDAASQAAVQSLQQIAKMPRNAVRGGRTAARAAKKGAKAAKKGGKLAGKTAKKSAKLAKKAARISRKAAKIAMRQAAAVAGKLAAVAVSVVSSVFASVAPVLGVITAVVTAVGVLASLFSVFIFVVAKPEQEKKDAYDACANAVSASAQSYKNWEEEKKRDAAYNDLAEDKVEDANLLRDFKKLYAWAPEKEQPPKQVPAACGEKDEVETSQANEKNWKEWQKMYDDKTAALSVQAAAVENSIKKEDEQKQ